MNTFVLELIDTNLAGLCLDCGWIFHFFWPAQESHPFILWKARSKELWEITEYNIRYVHRRAQIFLFPNVPVIVHLPLLWSKCSESRSGKCNKTCSVCVYNRGSPSVGDQHRRRTGKIQIRCGSCFSHQMSPLQLSDHVVQKLVSKWRTGTC